MPSPAEGVLSLLAAASPPVGVLSGTTGWRMFVGPFIDSTTGEVPDTQITAREIGGQAPNPKWLLDYPAVQVLIRGAPNGYQAARQKATDIVDVLLGQFPRTIGGDSWDAITVLVPPVFIGNDDKSRPQFSCDFRIIIEPAASGYTNRQPLGT